MRLIVALLFAVVSACGGDAEWKVDFESNDLSQWSLPMPEHWEVSESGGSRVLHLKAGGPIGANPRRPVKFAVFLPACVSDFELSVKLRHHEHSAAEEDALIAFGFQDRLHFYYAHLSSDNGTVAAHNGLYKVDGGDRERIAGNGSPSVLPDDQWKQIRIRRESASGKIELFVENETQPRFEAQDKSITFGRIGLGSFNDTAEFDDFHLRGKASEGCRDEPLNTLDSE